MTKLGGGRSNSDNYNSWQEDDRPAKPPPVWRGGRGKKKFCFTYADISHTTGLTEDVLRKRAERDKFNPADLNSLVDFINTCRKG